MAAQVEYLKWIPNTNFMVDGELFGRFARIPPSWHRTPSLALQCHQHVAMVCPARSNKTSFRSKFEPQFLACCCGPKLSCAVTEMWCTSQASFCMRCRVGRFPVHQLAVPEVLPVPLPLGPHHRAHHRLLCGQDLLFSHHGHVADQKGDCCSPPPPPPPDTAVLSTYVPAGQQPLNLLGYASLPNRPFSHSQQ